MTSGEPVLVYHGRSLSEAKQLASFLSENGVDVRLIEGDPLGHSHPASHVYHDLMVLNPEPEQLRVLTATWESQRTTSSATGSEMFCYHCGQELEGPVAVCPVCHEPLVD